MAARGIRRFTIEKTSRKAQEWKGSVNSLDPNVYDIFFYASGKLRRAEPKPGGYQPGEAVGEDKSEYKILKKLIGL
jgi:hypothetical protein